MKLQIENLRVMRGSFTLGPLSASLESGVIGLIGPNGAGKTTLLSVLGGVLAASGGGIFREGASRPLTALERRSLFSLAGLPAGWYEDLDVRAHLPVYRAACPEWDEARWQKWSHVLGVPLNKKVKSFSSGMRMRAALAISLARHTPFIALDEPWNTLDPAGRRELTKVLQDARLSLADDATIIVSSHELDRLVGVTDRLFALADGALIFQGSWQDARTSLGLSVDASADDIYEGLVTISG
jgi:ABC-2 type transport system ATP-binding protein